MKKKSAKIDLKKQSYHHGNLRAAVLAAALDLVERHGPAGFTLADAAAMVGVVPSALYRHFADREALLAAIAQEGFEMLVTDLESRLKNHADSRKALVEFGLAYFRFAIDQPARFQVMFVAEIDKKRYPPLLGVAARTLELLVKTARKAGPARRDLSAATWSIIHGTSLLALDGSFQRTGLCDQPEKMLRDSLHVLTTPCPPASAGRR